MQEKGGKITTDQTISRAKKFHLKFIMMIKREQLIKIALSILIIVQLVAFVDLTGSRAHYLKSGNLTLIIGYRVIVIYQSVILYFTNIKQQSLIYKLFGVTYIIAFSATMVYDGLCYPNIIIEFKLSWILVLIVTISVLWFVCY